jgi:hypothetical protein
VTVTQWGNKLLDSTATTRQRKRREKMKSLDFSLVQIWVPTSRILEIKTIAAGMIEERKKDDGNHEKEKDEMKS